MEKQYGYLITRTKTGIVNVSRIILGYGVEHEWHTQLIHSGKLRFITDQNLHYNNFECIDLDIYDKVWFNGALVYEYKPWWKIF